MKYKEQAEVVADLRALADFYERPEAIALPAPSLYEIFYVSVYKWKRDDAGKMNYVLDPERSKRKLKNIVKVLGSCEKDWGDRDLQVIKRFGHKTRLVFQVTRESICKKVPTGNKIIREATTHYVPERVEEEFEWVCEEVSLLS